MSDESNDRPLGEDGEPIPPLNRYNFEPAMCAQVDALADTFAVSLAHYSSLIEDGARDGHIKPLNNFGPVSPALLVSVKHIFNQQIYDLLTGAEYHSYLDISPGQLLDIINDIVEGAQNHAPLMLQLISSAGPRGDLGTLLTFHKCKHITEPNEFVKALLDERMLYGLEAMDRGFASQWRPPTDWRYIKPSWVTADYEFTKILRRALLASIDNMRKRFADLAAESADQLTVDQQITAIVKLYTSLLADTDIGGYDGAFDDPDVDLEKVSPEPCLELVQAHIWASINYWLMKSSTTDAQKLEALNNLSNAVLAIGMDGWPLALLFIFRTTLGMSNGFRIEHINQLMAAVAKTPDAEPKHLKTILILAGVAACMNVTQALDTLKASGVSTPTKAMIMNILLTELRNALTGLIISEGLASPTSNLMAFLDIFMDKVISHLIDISGEGGLIDPTTMLKRLGTQHPETQPQIDNFRHITEDLTDAGDLLNDQEFMQKIKDDNMAGAAIICRMYEHGTSRPLDAPPDDKEPKPFPVVLSVDKVEYVMRGARRILIMAMKIEAPAGLGRDKDSATQARILKTFMSEVTMADLKPHIPENIASKIDLPMLCILKVYCDLPSADDAEEEPKED